MRAFHCPSCRGLVFFHNFTCLSCRTGLGYRPESRSIVDPVDPAGPALRRCGNETIAGCNWLIPDDDPNPLCRSCRLTVLRPNDAELDHLAAFADAESAKRQLLDQLIGLGLPIDAPTADGPHLGFRMMADDYQRVVTGYQEGTITLDLAESDDAHRARVRQQLGELYRTVLGHLRHEIGHFYWWLLIAGSPHLDRFRELFGDEQIDYQTALDDHYRQTASGPGAGGDGDGTRPAGGGWTTGPWSDTHISAYATAHPWEDWAETFAHYLHILDGLETAEAFGLSVGEPSSSAGQRSSPPAGPDDDPAFTDLVHRWLGHTFALNAMARSIGQGDLYPFILSQPVVDKLAFVHHLVTEAATTNGTPPC